MALKVQAMVGPERAPGVTGLILGVGAIASLLAGPVFGRLSDRTTSRFGQRRPWLVGGALVLAVSLLAVAMSTSLPLILVAWFVAQIGAGAALAALVATIADQIPSRQRGTVAALVGAVQYISILVAVVLARALTSDMLALFMIPASMAVIGVLFYALVLPDKVLAHKPAKQGFRDVLATFWVNPRRHPDFGWAWISRFLLVLGGFLFTAFRLFWVQDTLGFDAKQAAGAIATGILIYTIAMAIVGQTSGWLSDRLARRKLFVFASTALYAVGLGMLTQVDTLGGFFIAEAILGAAYGIYVGIDLALVMDVLPNEEDTAKDLGVFNMANMMPQSLAPLLGAILLGLGAGANYDLLLCAAAASAFLGALTILPVKKVR
jgi:MFS family permease